MSNRMRFALGSHGAFGVPFRAYPYGFPERNDSPVERRWYGVSHGAPPIDSCLGPSLRGIQPLGVLSARACSLRSSSVWPSR